MAFTPAYAAGARAPLEKLWRWLCSRSTGAALSAFMLPQRIRDLAAGSATPRPQCMNRPDPCTADMFSVVWEQFERLTERLKREGSLHASPVCYALEGSEWNCYHARRLHDPQLVRGLRALSLFVSALRHKNHERGSG